MRVDSRRVLELFSLFAGFVLLSILRSPDALVTPILYAEDGVWLTDGINNGWLWVAFNARPDYPTFFHAAALFLAAELSLFFSGNILWLAAIFTAYIGYFTWAGVATFIYSTFQRFSDRATALFVAVGFIFVPMGSTSNETIGRVLQAGFLMPVLLALVLLRGNSGNKYFRVARAIVVLCLALTSPIVIPIWCGWYVLELIRNYKSKQRNDKVQSVLFVSLIVLAANIWLREKVPTAIPGGIKIESIVETVFARSFLYPGIAPVYTSFTDLTTVLVVLLLASLVFFLLRDKKSRFESSRITLPLAYVWLAYMIGTLATRPGLTQFMDGYTNTYPDRYFLGLNSISWLLVSSVIILIGKSVSQRISSHSARNAAKFFLVLVVMINVAYSTEVFGTRLDISHGKGWQTRLCEAQLTEARNGLKTIQIEPEPDWKVSVNSDLLDRIPCKRSLG